MVDCAATIAKFIIADGSVGEGWGGETVGLGRGDSSRWQHGLTPGLLGGSHYFDAVWVRTVTLLPDWRHTEAEHYRFGPVDHHPFEDTEAAAAGHPLQLRPKADRPYWRLLYLSQRGMRPDHRLMSSFLP